MRETIDMTIFILIRDLSGPAAADAVATLVRIGAVAVGPLCEGLRSSDRAVRLRAAEALVRIGEPAVEPLCAALADEDWGVRWNAAEALGKIGDARAVEPLCGALTDEESTVRRRAAEALGRIGDVSAVSMLILALSDTDGYVRRNAADALGAIGDSRAVEGLCRALDDSSVKVRWAAAAALAAIGAPAVQALCEGLKAADAQIRNEAAFALGRIGDARAVGPLCNAMKAADELIRSSAQASLVKIGAPAVDSLRQMLLAEEDWHLRWWAVRALSEIGDGRAVEAVCTALVDTEESVRAEARTTLLHTAQRFDPARAVLAARTVLASKGLTNTERVAALRTLYGSDLHWPLYHVVRGLTDDADPEVRAAAVAVLESLTLVRAAARDVEHEPLVRPAAGESAIDPDTSLRASEPPLEEPSKKNPALRRLLQRGRNAG